MRLRLRDGSDDQDVTINKLQNWDLNPSLAKKLSEVPGAGGHTKFMRNEINGTGRLTT